MADAFTTSEAADRRHPLRSQGGRIASSFRVVSILTLLSRVLGMGRDMVMAYAFGAGPLMDAFTVAFRVPNLARRLFGEGALATAFLPVFLRELESNPLRGGSEPPTEKQTDGVGGHPSPVERRSGLLAARRTLTAVTFVLAATLFGVVLLGELLLGLLWLFLVPGSEGRTLVLLTAQMLPYLLLICIAAQLSAALQAVERFFWPALLPTLLNVVWILAVWVALTMLEHPVEQIQLVALSVVAAGVLQCGVACWVTHAAGLGFASSWRSAVPQVREIARTMLPILFGLSITQINTIGDSLLAWGLARPAGPVVAADRLLGRFDWPLEPGTASALFYAQRMYLFPVGVFGIALGTVLFPLLARHAERGEREQVGHDQTLGLRLAIAIGLPASVGLMLLSERVSVLVFQRGAFTPADALLTADCIVAYASGIWAFLGIIIINRGFYALGDRLTPIRYGLMSVVVNLLLNGLLAWPLAGAGLAWATSVSAIVQMVLTVAAYQRRFGLLDFSAIATTTWRSIATTSVMAVACWLLMAATTGNIGLFDRLLSVTVPLLGGIVAYLAAARLTRLREPFILLSRGVDD